MAVVAPSSHDPILAVRFTELLAHIGGRTRVTSRWSHPDRGISARFDDKLITAAAVLAEDSGVVTTRHLLVAAIECPEPLSAGWELASSFATGLREGERHEDDHCS